MKDNATCDAIAANIHVLYGILRHATADVRQAGIAIAANEQNGAIGAMLHLKDELEQALGLYHAVIALHRNERSRP